MVERAGREWAYVDDLTDLPAAAEAARKASGTLRAGTRLEIQRPGTIDRAMPEIEEAEDRAAKLRQQLREQENEIDLMRKRTFTAFRRAKLRPEDALHLLANGLSIEVPARFPRQLKALGRSGRCTTCSP